jgi:hypothetical protein
MITTSLSNAYSLLSAQPPPQPVMNTTVYTNNVLLDNNNTPGMKIKIHIKKYIHVLT